MNIKRKKAFTLAEVLVTLAVIGVVAAMTIPLVFVRVKQHEYKTAGKKAFSIINNAVQTVTMQDGVSPENYINASDTQKATYFNSLKSKLIVINTDTDGDGNEVIYTSDGFAYHLVGSDEIYVDINGETGPTKIKTPMAQWKQADYTNQDDLYETSGWSDVMLTDVFYIGFDEHGKSVVLPYVQNAKAIAFPTQNP